MEKEFVPYEESLELEKLGFNEPCFMVYDELGYRHVVGIEDYSDMLKSPLRQQALKWFRDKYGLYTHFVPEFYKTGINFNWQIRWHLPQNEWGPYNSIMGGTGLYGDNNEFPTQEDAEIAAIEHMISLVKKGHEKQFKF